jgi:hypothetical protein
MQVGMALSPNSLARRKPGVQIPSPPPPNIAGQSVASVEQAALTAGCGRSTAARASPSPAQEARSGQATRPWPHMMTTERSRHRAAHPGSPPNGAILTRMWPILVDHAVDLATAPPPPTTTAESEPTPPWPSAAYAASIPCSDEPVADTAGEHADPAIPATRLPAHRRPPRPHPVGHSGRGNTRTPDSHSGHRTPGGSDAHTGLWTPVVWTDTRGDWTSAPDTGRRPLAAGRGCGHADEGTAGVRTSWATTPSSRALGQPTVFLWTAPAALGEHAGSAVGPSAGARLPAALPGSCSVAPPAEPRLGALLSSE